MHMDILYFKILINNIRFNLLIFYLFKKYKLFKNKNKTRRAA